MALNIAPKPTSSGVSNEASGHWYERHFNGTTTPLYPEGGTFGMRQARALSKEGRCVLPSVTTIFKDLHKGYLHDVWMPQQMVKAAFNWVVENILTKPTTMTQRRADLEAAKTTRFFDIFPDLKQSAFKETDEAATYGTAVHKALEDWLRDGVVDQEHAETVKAVEKEFEKHNFDAIHLEECVSNAELGYAGMCDVIARDFVDGRPLVIDFKTRKTKPNQTPNAYETDKMQIAAYGFAYYGDAFLEDGIGANIIISTTEPGRIYTRIHKDLKRHFKAFEGLCQYWRNSHNYEPQEI